ncbi:MAG: TrkA family potassium uptake protein [Candidatus Aminicenantes bacterium]|nr:TrkA family potassium uptake protein [Candidatus Aminicenantes bacterium]
MKFAVIGLGSFGANVARTLFERGNEVLAIDRDRDMTKAAKNFTTNSVMTEAAVKENLQALGVQEMDVVVVSLGHQLEASVMTVLYLHELGVKRIVAKALSEDHAKVLEAVGATEVIYPEKDMAIRTALRLSSPDVIEYLPLVSGITIQEIAPPVKFIGKTLKELDLTNKHGLQVIAIKEVISDRITFIPKADFVIKDSDILVIIGEEKRLSKLNPL